MPLENWRVLVCETVSGEVVADVVPSDFPQFERELCGAGSWQVSVLIDEKVNHAVDFANLAQDRRYSWAIAYGDYIVQAGPVWGYSFADESRTLTVSGAGMFSLFTKRILRHPYSTEVTPIGSDLVYTNGSLESIMWWLVEDSQRRKDHRLPIDMGTEPPAGTHQRHYHGYDMATFGERITDLSEVINGPEFDLAPYFTNDAHIRWRLKIGDPKLGDQDTPAVWDYGTMVQHIDVEGDLAVAPLTYAWVKGSGNEKDLKYGFAQNTEHIGWGVPPIDHINGDHTSASEPSTLNEYAHADTQRFRFPVRTYSTTVRIDGDGASIPRLGQWELGDAPTLAISGHPWLGELHTRVRVIGFSNDGPTTVKLELDDRI